MTSSFPTRYHDVDDEPVCRPFNCDFEDMPMDRESLKEAIVKEISNYHSKHPKPKLTPLATKFSPKPVVIRSKPRDTAIACTSKCPMLIIFVIFYSAWEEGSIVFAEPDGLIWLKQ